MNKREISELVEKRLNEIGINFLREKYEQSGLINHIIIDNLLPIEVA